MPIKITFDTNVLIAAIKAKLGTAGTERHLDEIEHLINLSKAGKISVQISAGTLAENNQTDDEAVQRLLANFDLIGLSRDTQILPLPAYPDFSRVDYTYLADETDTQLVENVRSLLFPTMPAQEATISRGIRNKFCDVLIAMSYIKDCLSREATNRQNVLVTNDSDDIRKHQSELQQLGAGHICTPPEAVQLINSLLEN